MFEVYSFQDLSWSNQAFLGETSPQHEYGPGMFLDQSLFHKVQMVQLIHDK